MEVALLAEGVDRNHAITKKKRIFAVSPSSRRAWIEIFNATHKTKMRYVALLAEGVDRNVPCHPVWYIVIIVALLAEGVDRNFAVGIAIA